MEHTSNYLKTVFLDLKQQNKKHPTLIFVILALLSIPLSHAFCSIATGLLVFVSLITFKKSNFRLERNLILPIALFVLMAISLIWTIDLQASLRALQKGLPLLLVPVVFLISPKFDSENRQTILRYFSCGMVLFTLFWLTKAIIRFAMTANSEVFFYHELVTEDVNAIHVSVYVVVSIFYFLTKFSRSLFEKMAVIILSVFMVLLSSKNILVIFLAISAVYYVSRYKSVRQKGFVKWLLVLAAILLIAGFGKIKDRFLIEYESITTPRTINHEIGNERHKVYNISASEAWNNTTFKQNDFFPGTAFRVYQIRIFTEMLQEDQVFFTGYGLNATNSKIEQKALQYHLYKGYEDKNFHNEYIQIFAELGIFGLLLLLAILTINIKNALKTKDFIHISFAILMISLFLTESFLSRQRGIVFFTIMYCLFNSGSSVIALKKE